MSYYVRVKMLGRADYYRLATWLEQSGVGEVDYFDGGWSDYHPESIASHIKFELEEDATAYVLKYGGEYSKKIPEKVPGKDFLPGG